MNKSILNSEWVYSFSQFNKLVVGFSGGLDSTVLVHALASHEALRNKLIAVHINHGISENSLCWQKHCEQFCQDSGVNFVTQSIEFDRLSNIEEEARNARHAVLASFLTSEDCLILGHHRDDQAETLLLQLFRGAGIDGLSAMTELSQSGNGTLARPLLSIARQQLEDYAADHELQWIEDESNLDINYSRNFLRQQVMPLIRKKWPSLVTSIARTATHCQQARMSLDELALADGASSDARLLIEPLKTLSLGRIANVLRVWLKKNQIQLPSTLTFKRLITELVLASPDAMPLVSWSKIQVRRYRDSLYLDKENQVALPSCINWTDFPAPLEWGDTIQLLAKKSSQGLIIPEGAEIQIRFRRGGEHFTWHGQTKQLKKLMQEWGIPPWLRDRTPLIFINNELAAIPDYAISDTCFSKNSKNTCYSLTVP